MERPVNTAIRIAAGLGTLALIMIAWPFAIPGVLLSALRRGDYPHYVGSALALMVVVAMRVGTGGWFVRIGGLSSGQWYVELFLCSVAWALGAIVIAIGFRLASLAFRGTPPNESCKSSVETQQKPRVTSGDNTPV